MASAFMAQTLPPRSYGVGVELAVSAAVRTAPQRPVKVNPRVDQLVQALSACNEGYASRGILRLALGNLAASKLTLVEEAVVALHDRQREHEAAYGVFDAKQQKKLSHLMFGEFAYLYQSPYSHIVNAVVPDFNAPALTGFGFSSKTPFDLKIVAALCTVMAKANVPVTESNLGVQFSAYHKVSTVQAFLSIDEREVYLSNPALVLAVHKYPTRVNELIQMFRTRGSVEAADEVFATTSAVSDGAL